MGKTIEGEAHLRELTEKCKYEDDPLLRAMKKELSTRIFGPPLNSLKRDEFEDSQMYRNPGSPLANGDKFLPYGLTINNYNLLKENEDYQWFSILPKDSCDPKSLMLGESHINLVQI